MHRMQSGGWPYSKVGRDSYACTVQTTVVDYKTFMQAIGVKLNYVYRHLKYGFYISLIEVDNRQIAL